LLCKPVGKESGSIVKILLNFELKFLCTVVSTKNHYSPKMRNDCLSLVSKLVTHHTCILEFGSHTVLLESKEKYEIIDQLNYKWASEMLIYTKWSCMLGCPKLTVQYNYHKLVRKGGKISYTMVTCVTS
jgi:hypothetical protein